MKLIPPIPVLRAFEVVARLSSFTKAADELNVTRSAISRRIQILEDTLGAPVFARKPKTLRLTPTGAAYLLVVRKALTALADVAAQHSGRRRKRRMTVSTPPTFGRLSLISRLPAFLEAHPDVEISIELSMSQVDDPVGEVDCDIRFGTGSYPGMESQLVSRHDLIAVASPAYIEAQQLLAPSDLAKATLLRSKLEPWAPWLIAAGLDGEEPIEGHRFEDLSLLYGAAASGLGVAPARTSLAKPWLANETLVPLFDIKAKARHAYYLIYRPDSIFLPEISTLAELLNQDLDA